MIFIAVTCNFLTKSLWLECTPSHMLRSWRHKSVWYLTSQKGTPAHSAYYISGLMVAISHHIHILHYASAAYCHEKHKPFLWQLLWLITRLCSFFGNISNATISTATSNFSFWHSISICSSAWEMGGWKDITLNIHPYHRPTATDLNLWCILGHAGILVDCGSLEAAHKTMTEMIYNLKLPGISINTGDCCKRLLLRVLFVEVIMLISE